MNLQKQTKKKEENSRGAFSKALEHTLQAKILGIPCAFSSNMPSLKEISDKKKLYKIAQPSKK